MQRGAADSMDTILTFKKDDALDNLSDWSVELSTSHVPGMDTAIGGGWGSRRRKTGRRRLRCAALTLGSVLTMHAGISASALTTGYFIFMMLMIPAVGVVGNCMRHFEVYLGQWSISGPGRAFRIIPMFDGIGIAICINAILRAVVSVGMSAIAAIYVINAARDDTLPFTYCRDMNLKAYNATMKYVKVDTAMGIIETDGEEDDTLQTTLVYDEYIYRRARTSPDNSLGKMRLKGDSALARHAHTIQRTYFLCNETFPTNYPPVFKTPPYNYFYVEVVHYRPDHDVRKFNMMFIYVMMAIWVALWALIIIEKITNGRIVWNNMSPWLGFVPWAWSILVLATGIKIFFSRKKPLRNVVRIGGDKEVLNGMADAITSALYIHASGIGSELIHGKGLNHYASGHIDPYLHGENFWHSAALLMLTAISTGGAAACALTDYMQMTGVNKLDESSLWIFPMYSKCAAVNSNYQHLTSAVIFSGLSYSYGTVAFSCIKTALHTIFEYKVTLVFYEQIIVAALLLSCMAMSVPFATNGGVALLESLDLVMATIATPLICVLELIGLVFVYRSHDFISDMNVATEENACSTRIGIMWSIIPFILLGTIVAKCVVACSADMPAVFMWIASGGVFLVLLAMPLRAAHNALVYLRPPKSH